MKTKKPTKKRKTPSKENALKLFRYLLRLQKKIPADKMYIDGDTPDIRKKIKLLKDLGYSFKYSHELQTIEMFYDGDIVI